MPVTSSAIKKSKQDKKARLRNRAIRDNYKKAIKTVKKLVSAGDTKKATESLSEAFSKIDRAAKKKVLHKNNAARKKSRLSKLVSPEGKKKKTSAKKATKP